MVDFTELRVIPVYAKTDTERVELRISRDNFFRYYLRIGKSFYDSMDETWRPTKDGATIPLNIESASGLALALCSLLSFAEAKGLLDDTVKQTIRAGVASD